MDRDQILSICVMAAFMLLVIGLLSLSRRGR
jgi:hypothetical protein